MMGRYKIFKKWHQDDENEELTSFGEVEDEIGFYVEQASVVFRFSKSNIGTTVMDIGTADENIYEDMYNFIKDGNNFTSSNQSTNISDDRIVYTSSWTNISTSDLVVTTVGVNVHNTSWGKSCFIEITKLETPITIKPNETKTFTSYY